MKRNVLALSIAAMIGGVSGLASAGVVVGTGPGANKIATPDIANFALAEGGVGHALVVPYYTAQNGNITVLHLVNTDTDNGKVVKVRFRGASNSDDVLDFQVLMSPGDVWTGYVSTDADGVAKFSTDDNTCTLPSFKDAGGSTSFKTLRLNPALSADQQANQTREGYIEIFNSANIPNVPGNALYTTTKHSAAGAVACASATIEAALYTTDWTTEAQVAAAGMDSPTGGLMGDWYILNAGDTTAFSGAATALVGVGGTIGNYIAFPQNAGIAFDASVATLDPTNFTTDPLLAGGFDSKTGLGVLGAAVAAPVLANAQDFPDFSTPYIGPASPANAQATAEALTAALAVTSITNQYAKDASINAKTDWVFSMPTRRYSVAMNYATSPVSRMFNAVDGAGDGSQYFSTDNTSVADGKICVTTQAAVFRGREEESKSGVPTFSPSASSTPRMCGETSVLSFGEGVSAPSVLGASVAREDVGAASIFTHGWGRLTTTNQPAAGTAIGLPIAGYSVQKLTNTGPGVNYGVTWPHRFTRP